MRAADTVKPAEPADLAPPRTAERAVAVLELAVGAINRLAEIGAVLCFSTLVLIIVAGIFCRYVLNDSLVWTEELARYLFIWVTFLGGGLGVGRNIHVGVDSLMRLLPSGIRRWLELLIEVSIGVFVAALVAIGVQYTEFGMNSQALLFQMPMGYVYLAVPVGGVIMLANVVVNIARHLARMACAGSSGHGAA